MAISRKVSFGSLGVQIGAGQFLPLRDRKADIAYGKNVVHRSNRFDCPLSDREADLGRGPCEGPLLAEGCRCSQTLSNVRVGSTTDSRDLPLPRLLSGV